MAAVAPPSQAAALVPAHVFAPYFETWTGQNPFVVSEESGAKFVTLAFLQTASPGSCTVYWNGLTRAPVAYSDGGRAISAIQATGGGVIPSFGGYSADSTGTDIADSCASVPAIAQAYESLITTYHVSRIDLDVEAASLTDPAGITRRNEAIAEVESWAASTGHAVQFSYTLPTNTTGLDAEGLAVLADAVAQGAMITTVNIMTFDYYIGTPQDMAVDTETAAEGLYSQLATLYPGKSSAQLWGMIGVTDMMGIDDYGPDETFNLVDAPIVEAWAVAHGLGELSYWAVQRDNGGCPGVAGANNCSGIPQPTWYFDHVYEPFTAAFGGVS